MNKGLILLAATTLASCTGTTKETIITDSMLVEREIPILPRPRPLELENVEWKVVNGENLEQFLTDISSKDGSFVFFALSAEGYERIALNLAEIERFISQQNGLIVYYEDSINPVRNQEDDQKG